MVANMPVYGVNQGTQPIVGFNYGAKRFDRVKQALLTGILYASALTVLGFLVAMLIPGPVMGLFINAKTPNRSALIDIGRSCHANVLPVVAAGRFPGRQRQLLPGHGQAAGGHAADAFAAGFSAHPPGLDPADSSSNSTACGWPCRSPTACRR